jgi:hypothetical protein
MTSKNARNLSCTSAGLTSPEVGGKFSDLVLLLHFDTITTLYNTKDTLHHDGCC